MSAARVRPAVLLIDDDADTREVLSVFLELDGFDVQTARNGMEGLTRAAESLPDVIVTDLRMPGCDGWELVRRFKQGAHTRSIPLVVLTPWIAAEKNQSARSLCDAFLTKPCAPDVLAREIHRVLNNASTSGERDALAPTPVAR